jgi:hypothetical protein
VTLRPNALRTVPYSQTRYAGDGRSHSIAGGARASATARDLAVEATALRPLVPFPAHRSLSLSRCGIPVDVANHLSR